MALFEILDLVSDPEPRPAALNMAMDEAILAEISVPTLRAYRWLRRSVSFGCFERYSEVEKQHPGCDLVRRWTGGGVVLHDGDFTYSLMVPRGGALGQAGPGQWYLAIHERLARTLRDCGLAALTAGGATPKISSACFENAVCHDVLLGERKIAGAAQRRTRWGLLHQGSIQGVELPGDFAQRLAANLGVRVIQRNATQSELKAAAALAKTKYATPEWTRKF
ncbi:MAG TPA: hypothetical protein VG733_07530 [Chthoniobacteraceae bacterium]|nr:hypothetical protein [Chthoniobacteraceae bacterium]